MSFSYDSEDLATDLNHLRFLVQDTTDAGHFFEDAELTFALTQEANIYRTAAGLCRAIAAKLSKTPSLDNVALKFDAGERAATYLKLAANYDKKADEFDESMNSGESGGLNLPTLPDREASFTRGLHFS